VLLVLPLLFTTVLIGLTPIPLAHAAATGTVCLIDPSATMCPSPPQVFTGPSAVIVGTQLRVGVFIQGSDSLNGFDITLFTNHTKLKPFDVDLTNSVMPPTPPAGTTTILLKCISGIQKGTGACNPATDTLDTIHFSESAAGSCGTATSPPCPTTGLLLTAIFNIVGDTAAPISVGFQTGCAGTSVPTGNTCVSVFSSVTGGINSETAQAATYSTTTNVPFFSLSTSPASINVVAGAPATSSVTITVQGTPNSFACGILGSCINLTPLVPNVKDLGAFVSPLPPVSETTSPISLTVSTTASTPVGNYTVFLLGSSSSQPSPGTTYLGAVVNVTVRVWSLAISASPLSLTIPQGSFGLSTITLTSLGGLAGSITFTPSSFAPTTTTNCATPGVVCPTFNFNPTPVTLTAGGTATSTLNVTTTSSTTLGAYTLTVRAITSSPLQPQLRFVKLSINVSPFKITASPVSVTANAGPVGGSSIITVTAVGGYTGSVTFSSSSSPVGLSCSYNNQTVILVGSNSTKLSCDSLTQAVFTVTATGVMTITGRGSFLNSAVTTFRFQDYTIQANPASMTLNAFTNATSTITVTSVSPFAATVTLSWSASPTFGIDCTLKPASVSLTSQVTSGTSTLSCKGGANSYIVTVTGTDSAGSQSVNVTLTVQDFTLSANPSSVNLIGGIQGNSTITARSATGKFTGPLSLTFTSTSGLTCTLSDTSILPNPAANSTLFCTASTLGSFSATVNATSILPAGSLSHTITVSFVVEKDFSIGAVPARLPLDAGAAGTSMITVTSLNGFAGALTLSESVSPSGLTCSLTKTSLTLGSSDTSTLSCNGSVGTYTVTVSVTNMIVTHSTKVTVNVVDFTIGATSPVAIVGSATSTITLIAVNGFSDAVSLSDTPLPAGLTCGGITPSSLAPPQTASLSCSSTTAGTFTVTITATIRSLSHPTIIKFTFTDFTVSVSPASLTILAGDKATATISVSGLEGFTGTILLTASSSSSALSSTLSMSSITLSGTTASSTSALTISVPSSTSVGSYTITVTSTSGSLSHPVTVSLQVNAVQHAPQIFGLAPSLFYGLAGGIVLAIVASAIILLRRKSRP